MLTLHAHFSCSPFMLIFHARLFTLTMSFISVFRQPCSSTLLSSLQTHPFDGSPPFGSELRYLKSPHRRFTVPLSPPRKEQPPLFNPQLDFDINIKMATIDLGTGKHLAIAEMDDGSSSSTTNKKRVVIPLRTSSAPKRASGNGAIGHDGSDGAIEYNERTPLLGHTAPKAKGKLQIALASRKAIRRVPRKRPPTHR